MMTTAAPQPAMARIMSPSTPASVTPREREAAAKLHAGRARTRGNPTRNGSAA